jgi:hypothetical protein
MKRQVPRARSTVRYKGYGVIGRVVKGFADTLQSTLYLLVKARSCKGIAKGVSRGQ